VRSPPFGVHGCDNKRKDKLVVAGRESSSDAGSIPAASTIRLSKIFCEYFASLMVSKKIQMGWFVYILECSDKSFYVGHTENLDARLKAHNSGKGALYTSIRRPVILLYREPHQTKKSAIKRELQIKKWSRAKKQALINGDLAKLHQLSKRRHP